MAEQICVYKNENVIEPTSMDRGQFYAEQTAVYKAIGEPTLYCEVINMLFINKAGEIIIQKRSAEKTHNANLFDKSIGGHVVFGDAIEYTVMVETIQELQTPSIVVKDESHFQKTLHLLKDHLETVAVVCPISTQFKVFTKQMNNEKIGIGNKTNFFIGVYDGKIRFADKEVKGIMFYTLDELEAEVVKNPDNFTEDLKVILQENRDAIVRFTDMVKV